MKHFAYTSLLAVVCVVAACTKANTSETKDLGTLKHNVSAVAVYQPNAAKHTWDKSPDVAIKKGAEVLTVDGPDQRPKLFTVKLKKSKQRLKLVEVVFKNQEQTSWSRGYVLLHCFDWDTSKHVTGEILNQAVKTKAGPSTESPATVSSAKQMCGL